MVSLKNAVINVIKYMNDKGIRKQTEFINIGYGIDNNFSRCVATSIVSFIYNNPEKHFVFHIVGADLSKNSISKLKILAEKFSTNIIIYEVNTICLKKLPTNIYSPISTYFRFILPFILVDVDKLFYIDADVICINKATNLFSIQLKQEGYIIAAVPDVGWANEQQNKLLNLNNHIYFNAGVLIIDIKKWNDYDTFDKAMYNLINEPEKFPFFDQDVLNLVLTGKIKYLSSIYNYMDIEKINQDNLKEIILVHFSAHPKPWSVGWKICSKANKYNLNLYSNFEKLTPYIDMPLIEPRNYKEFEHYAKDLRKHGKYIRSLLYYLQYIKEKIKIKYLNI